MAIVTASYDQVEHKLSLSGGGFAVEPVTAEYTHPDGSVEKWHIGVFGDGTLDNNYILATEQGSWIIKLFQPVHKKFELVAETTISI